MLERAMDELAVEDRQVIGMCQIAGLSRDAAGELLGKSAGAVRVQLNRALVRLGGALAGTVRSIASAAGFDLEMTVESAAGMFAGFAGSGWPGVASTAAGAAGAAGSRRGTSGPAGRWPCTGPRRRCSCRRR